MLVKQETTKQTLNETNLPAAQVRFPIRTIYALLLWNLIDTTR